MQTTYRMNADDLNPDFVENLKVLFRHKQIEITVHETDDTTELEERRDVLATEAQDALTLFRQGHLPAQSSSALIAQLRADLAQS